MRESNSHQRFWRPLSYHLTNPLFYEEKVTITSHVSLKGFVPSKLHTCYILMESFYLCVNLAPLGQQRRPPPVAETGSRCWGSGQQDARNAQRMLGAATRPCRAKRLRGQAYCPFRSYFPPATAGSWPRPVRPQPCKDRKSVV